MAAIATVFLMPWALSAQRIRKFDPNGGPPICLVTTSFWGWGAAMFGLHKSLKARGAQNVYLVHLAFSRGAIDRMGDVLTQEIEKLSGQIGGYKPYLVAHGIAGIAACGADPAGWRPLPAPRRPALPPPPLSLPPAPPADDNFSTIADIDSESEGDAEFSLRLYYYDPPPYK